MCIWARKKRRQREIQTRRGSEGPDREKERQREIEVTVFRRQF